MHIDASQLENNTLIEGDICIIGAGAAGISIALEWNHTPYKVILLEGGGFDFDPKIQNLYAGKITGQRYFPLSSARLHYFGGTTGHWGGYCAPHDPIDFEKRDWIENSGWPINRKDLDPYYRRASVNLDLGPFNYTTDYFQNKDPNMIPLPLDSSVVVDKMWQFSKPTKFGEKYKQTIVDSPNIYLYTKANVVEILSNENSSEIEGVVTKNFEGRNHKVKAKHFILACCTIQNARVLLASQQRSPKGLGNDHDLVGRYFMEHVEVDSGELWLLKPSWLKLYMLSWTVTKARAELGVSAQKQEEYKILNGTLSLKPLNFAKKIKPTIDMWSHEDPRASLNQLNTDISKAVKSTGILPETGTNSYQLFTRVEQAPNPNSRVTLEPEKDGLGMPRATLHWELTAFEKRSIRKIHQIIGEEMGRSNVGRIKVLDYLQNQDDNDNSWPDFVGGGWHHMGTTRMNEDPKKGVVDVNCKVHGISNLFIAGASCFPTAGSPNPTFTLVSLSIRLSDHLKEIIKA